ncbi:HNH endonuclease [Frigidibacter albus]
MAVTRKEFARFSRPILNTRRWQVLRHLVLERDGWKCRDCGDRRRLEVDHIKAVRIAPELAFDMANLAVRCSSCHTKKTRIECGHPPPVKSPERDAWAQAVAALATEPPRASKETPCLKA